MPTNIIAVYGTLRAGLNNHSLISKCKRIGHGWLTGFRMYNLGDYPGAIRTHDESGRMRVEWYDVSDGQLAELDKLEGYCSDKTHSSLYIRKYVGSPYGRGWIYIYNRDVDENTYMEAGDWTRFLRESMSPEEFMALAMSETIVGKDAQNTISLDIADAHEPSFNEDVTENITENVTENITEDDRTAESDTDHDAFLAEDDTSKKAEKNQYTFEVIRALNAPSASEIAAQQHHANATEEKHI